jgi:hypothetical protein
MDKKIIEQVSRVFPAIMPQVMRHNLDWHCYTHSNPISHVVEVTLVVLFGLRKLVARTDVDPLLSLPPDSYVVGPVQYIVNDQIVSCWKIRDDGKLEIVDYWNEMTVQIGDVPLKGLKAVSYSETHSILPQIQINPGAFKPRVRERQRLPRKLKKKLAKQVKKLSTFKA